MITGWMLYTLLTTSLLIIAGGAAERLLRAMGAPTRLVWSSVIAAAMALSGLNGWSLIDTGASTHGEVSVTPARRVASRIEQPDEDVQARPGQVSAFERTHAANAARTGVAETMSVLGNRMRNAVALELDAARWQRFDAMLIASCVSLALIGIFVVIASLFRQRRMTKALASCDVDGVAVLVSPGTGPAVFGFIRPHVVIPRWVVALPAEERHAILLHEQEHVAARDPMLVLLGALALAVQPWNIAFWIAFARLRFAIETDCDARVLRRSCYGVRRYGTLLLRVHEHECTGRGRDRFPVTAFVDSTSHLERRVHRMINRPPKLRSLSTVVACVAGLLVVAVAFTVRVSSAQALILTPEGAMPAREGIPSAAPTAKQYVTEESSTLPPTPSIWRSGIPDVVNSERETPAALSRLTMPTLPSEKPTIAPIDRTLAQRSFMPETLFLHASNPIWPMKARIITTEPAGAPRVLVTDMSGRPLIVADTLEVDFPVKLLPPDAPFHVRIESRSGDLSLTTSPIPAPDGKGGRFIATVLGRGLLAWRDAADTHTTVMADGVGYIRGQRIP